MESLIQAQYTFKYYADIWERVIYRAKIRLGDGYDEWLNTVDKIEDIKKIPFSSDLPDTPKDIVISANVKLASAIKNAMVEFIEGVKPICNAPNSNVQAYYNIQGDSYQLGVYSYDKHDLKYKSKCLALTKDVRKKFDLAVDIYNSEVENDLDKPTFKHSWFSDSTGVAKDKENNSRGHLVDDNTEFEITGMLDYERLVKRGKGHNLSDADLKYIFGVFSPENVQIGNIK
jgi:hypothetical protein